MKTDYTPVAWLNLLFRQQWQVGAFQELLPELQADLAEGARRRQI